ncbi:MAG: glycosyltransferase family A protein [Sphingomonadaceae bacterium]
MSPTVEVLIPSGGRKTGLAVVLASLFGQTFREFDLVISDQGDDEGMLESQEIRTLMLAFRYRGRRVRSFRHLPRRGLAEHRHFLLSQSEADYVHFLDDDVLLEPETMERMLRVMQQERIGFVGCAATGLSYLDDFRPWQHNIDLWEGPVKPEPFDWDRIPWDRHKVNNAANPLHLAEMLVKGGEVVRYKVAWVGGANVLYDRKKLLDVGGFSWWDQLPDQHAGEEVLAQLLLLRKYGGCGILPSGTYHLELPTLVPNREVNATSLFQRLVGDSGDDTHR